jgi:hypothetical protein
MHTLATHHPILLYGAYGHTARFIITALIDQGFTPILSGRDREQLAVIRSLHAGLEVRVASVGDPVALHRALSGVSAVINAAGPFALTAFPIVEAAIKAGVHYLDVAAEADVVATTIDRYAEDARNAGIVLAPAIGFYGGLGNLLATAAMGNWAEADEITLAYSLSSWAPTQGTRVTIDIAAKRRGGQRLTFTKDGLTLRNDAAPLTQWTFPAPIGVQTVVSQFTTADAVTLSHHVKAGAISEYMTTAPLSDLSGPALSSKHVVDDRGRSAQTFLLEAVVRAGAQQRRAVARGQDIYAVTAPLVVEALKRLMEPSQQWRGVITAAEFGDARAYLAALVPQHLTVEFD